MFKTLMNIKDIKDYDNLLILEFNNKLRVEITDYTLNVYDKSFDYTKRCKEIAKKIKKKHTDNKAIFYYTLKTFLPEYYDCAGFEESEETKEKEKLDDFWDYLRSIEPKNKDKIDKEQREIIIYTFGNKFNQYKSWCRLSKKNFGATIINSKRPKGINLRKARGTDERLQETVQMATQFQPLMTNIVEAIETLNLPSIGIYCTAGHHRSVACGEMLKNKIYKKAIVKHLTINK